MPNIKLYSITNPVQGIPSFAVAFERELQNLIEQNMPVFFGVTFLKSEFSTSHGGRIDSLGIDENNCPVIFEYKRSSNENVINQGLFYLDWLLDHKAEFELLVMSTLGHDKAAELDWSMPRLICVAGDFTKYDSYAVNQINRNIELWRYAKFGDSLLMLELLNAKTTQPLESKADMPGERQTVPRTSFEQQLASAPTTIQTLYESIRAFITSLGDDITENRLKLYAAFKKMRNFTCVELQQKKILLHVNLNPEGIVLEKGFTVDVRSTGHYGTGDLRIIVHSKEDFEKAKPLIEQAYLQS